MEQQISEPHTQENLVEIHQLKKYFPIRKGFFQRLAGEVKAVDDVSLDIRRGETVGLVGESGCGKSTLGRTIIGLYEPSSGSLQFKHQDITKLRGKERKGMKRQMQMVFQDPYASMNPRMRIVSIIGEPLLVHSKLSRKARYDRVAELVEQVGLKPDCMQRFPHEFSGGQRQRIAIARSLALNPDFIVCDEPVSSLDVSIRAQIINLLDQLQKKFNLTYLFISHDLAVVRHISNRVAVMYLGKIVELANRADIYLDPLHPYTRGLLTAIPIPDPDVERVREKTELFGDIPSPSRPPKGCRFHTRCPLFEKGLCNEKEPEYREVYPEHWVACHLV
jgi:oligopeptide transport system ATP-binding protein